MSHDMQVMMIGALGALVLSSTASAQTIAGGTATAQLEEVLITGSRVITSGNDSPTPVTVVTTEDLMEVRPGNLAEALNEMPAFAGARGLNSNTGTAGQAGSPATSNNAANVANLRQLGLLRTLVLQDGRRVAPTTPDGYVDMNTIPQMLVKRVDVVTGGVSAVYGSDAIAGVMNFVTDTEFQGFKGNLQAGRSDYGDAETADAGLAFGTELFGGRGHFIGSFESRYSAPIDSKLDRPWGREVRTIQGNGTAAFPLVHVKNVRVGNLTFGGRVNGASNLTTNPLFDQRFTSGGYLVPFVHGPRDGITDANNERGGDGAFYFAQLRAGLESNQAYARLDYDFTDTVNGYLSVQNSLNHSVGTGVQFNSSTLSIHRDNAFLLPQYRAAMVAANQTIFTFGKMFNSIPRTELETYSRNLNVTAGLRGELFNDYDWEVSVANSRGSFDVRQNAAINFGRLYAALDSVVVGGVPVCRAAATNPVYAGCVPMNVFGENSESQAAIDYVVERLEWDTNISMQNVAASLTGSPFSSWAGPVNAALSAEWRRLSYEIDSRSPSSNARANCTGIGAGLNCNANTRTHNSGVDSVPEITTTTSEAAIELGVPLLQDAPLAQSLDLNAAYRFAHYDRAGDANTWKAGLTWDPIDMLTVRATRSRDFRAPSLDENFRALATTFGNVTDRLTEFQTGTGAVGLTNVRTENSGNANLKPETADTVTFGVVLRPTPNMDFAVDLFKIKVKDAITAAQGNNRESQLACYASGGTSPLCDLFERLNGNPVSGNSTTNPIVLSRTTFVNAGLTETEGVDLEASFRTSLVGRPASLRLLATYQPHLINQLIGAAALDSAGVVGGGGLQAQAKWRATAFLRYNPTDELTLAMQYRWRQSLELSPVLDPVPVEASKVKSVGFTNLNISYKPQALNGTMDVFFNVQNVFNTEPPHAGNYLNQQPGQLGESAFGDDVIGRNYTVGVRVRL